MRQTEGAIDPTDLRPWRVNPCEREVTLLCSLIRQAFSDADAIGRGSRLTGETFSPHQTSEFMIQRRATHLAELREWMTRDASHGLFSLEGICDKLECAIGQRVDADAIRRVIELALAGKTPAGLLDFRTVNVAGGNPSATARNYRVENERRRERQARAHDRRQQEAAA